MNQIFNILEWMKQWFKINTGLILLLTVISVFLLIGTIILIPVMIVYLPEDYFITSDHSRFYFLKQTHPVLRILMIFFKNFFGLLFVIIGIFLLFLPGQGLLTIALGIILIDTPGKKRILLKLVKRPQIKRVFNQFRKRFNKPELIIPD